MIGGNCSCFRANPAHFVGHLPIWSSAATPIQAAAVVAFTPNTSLQAYVRHSALVHGYIAGQLYNTLVQLGVPCPRPAGGFYLYPDFSPWRTQLLERGVRTSQELVHYLLEEWDIAALPGSVFNEEPLALRLRLSTSLLCEPEHGPSPEEREAALWNILDQAESLQPTGEKSRVAPSLPALARAEERLSQVIHVLETQRTHQ